MGSGICQIVGFCLTFLGKINEINPENVTFSVRDEHDALSDVHFCLPVDSLVSAGEFKLYERHGNSVDKGVCS